MLKPYHIEVAYENLGQRDRRYWAYVCTDCSRSVKGTEEISIHAKWTRKQVINYVYSQLKQKGLAGMVKKKDYVFYEV